MFWIPNCFFVKLSGYGMIHFDITQSTLLDPNHSIIKGLPVHAYALVYKTCIFWKFCQTFSVFKLLCMLIKLFGEHNFVANVSVFDN